MFGVENHSSKDSCKYYKLDITETYDNFVFSHIVMNDLLSFFLFLWMIIYHPKLRTG